MSEETTAPSSGSNIVKGFKESFAYFSILPFKNKEVNPDREYYSVMLFTMPFVGLVLGLISLFVFGILQDYFSLPYAAFLSAVLYLVLYGFIHLEAVSDVIDAIFASYSGKNVSAVMKEPQVGAIGAVGTAVMMLLKLAAITYLLINENSAMFLAAIVLSRFAAIVGLGLFDFKKGGKYTIELNNAATFKLVFFAAIFYISMVAFPMGVSHEILLTVVACVVTLFTLYKLLNRFGFLNGDCVGFTIVVTEIVLLNLGLLG